MTYPTNRIISALCNPVDPNKVEEYAEIMRYMGLQHDFPPILGFESTIDEDDVENGVEFMTGELVTEDHLGLEVWRVTDGHHRTLANIEAGLGWIEVEKDYNTCVTQEELDEFKNRLT